MEVRVKVCNKKTPSPFLAYDHGLRERPWSGKKETSEAAQDVGQEVDEEELSSRVKEEDTWGAKSQGSWAGPLTRDEIKKSGKNKLSVYQTSRFLLPLKARMKCYPRACCTL